MPANARPWNGRRLIGAAALAGLLPATMGSGCSLIFVDGPPPASARTPAVECTTSNAWPVVDTLLAGYQVVRTVYAVSQPESAYQGMTLSRSSDIAFGTALLLLTGISAGVGYSRVSDCHEAMESAPWPTKVPRVRATARPSAPPPGPGAIAPGPMGAPQPTFPRPTAPAAEEEPAVTPSPQQPAAPRSSGPAAPQPSAPTVPQQIDPE